MASLGLGLARCAPVFLIAAMKFVLDALLTLCSPCWTTRSPIQSTILDSSTIISAGPTECYSNQSHSIQLDLSYPRNPSDTPTSSPSPTQTFSLARIPPNPRSGHTHLITRNWRRVLLRHIQRSHTWRPRTIRPREKNRRYPREWVGCHESFKNS